MNTSNPVSKNIQNNLSMHGNATLGKLHYRRPSMIFTNTIFNTTFFSQQSCTLGFTSCLSKKLKKQDLTYFLVTDIINIITYLEPGPHITFKI
jgi:hypothetical protein